MSERQKLNKKEENYCLEHKGTYGSPITPPLATPHMITQNFPQVVIITQVVMITQHFLQVVMITQHWLKKSHDNLVI